jgi:two-component system, NarL family, nitrate/nitrite sensor histidine kinase NarX
MSLPSAPVRAEDRSGLRDELEARVLEDRARWAMRIHDGLTQTVTSAVLELQSLRKLVLVDPAGAAASLSAVEAAIRADLREIRELLFELYEDRRAPVAPLGEFVESLVSRWGLPARISIEGDADHAPAAVIDAAHAVIAEALANAAKHADTPNVDVRVHADAIEFRVEVEDRGRGIGDVADDDPHFGLRMMRARAEDIGGTIEIDTTPGGGTRVVALLPVGGRGEER